MPDFGARVKTTTQDKILPFVVNDILSYSPLVKDFLTSAKKWSGEQIKPNITYQAGTSGTSFSGLDLLPTTQSDRRIQLAFSPKKYAKNVSIAFDEATTNEDQTTKIIDLIKVEMATSAQEMADELATQLYGDGTGNSSKDFLGLTAIVDDATSVATIGGKARATYTALNSTVTASGGTISLSKLMTLWDNASDGGQQPTDNYTTKAVKSLYAQLLQAQERTVKAATGNMNLVGNTGYNTLAFMGTPVKADGKCTTGVWYMINRNFINLYARPFYGAEPIKFMTDNIEGNDYTDLMGLGFSWGGWLRSSNQAGMNGFIYLFGELIPTGFKRHAKLTAITGV